MLDRAMLPSTMDIVSRYGYSVNKAGYMKCPFHPDKTASLKIYPGNRGWHCFGCQSGGSTIDFIMKIENCNFKDALEKLNVQCEFKPNHKIKMQRNLEAEKRKQKEEYYWEVFDELKRLDTNRTRYKPKIIGEPLHELFIEALQKLHFQEQKLALAEWRLRKWM
jgi:hypothetical protein